jgi:hypothetical protein
VERCQMNFQVLKKADFGYFSFSFFISRKERAVATEEKTESEHCVEKI